MIHFNDPDYAKRRAEVKSLTLEEEKEAVEIINDYASSRGDNPNHIELLQRLIWNYENLCHFKSVNSGKETGDHYAGLG